MTEKKLRNLLLKIREGTMSVDEAVEALGDLPFQDMGFARIDHHRDLRCGQGEVVFCEGKTPEQVAEISEVILEKSDTLLCTRASPGHFEAVHEKIPGARYERDARCVVLHPEDLELSGQVLVLTGGTSDIPVASEARVTSMTMGARTRLISDVGVAGIHRLLKYSDEIRSANAIVVVAGMEGALASVVGGLTSKPVIGVPASIGYGASLNGFAPLLTMLNSCSAGVSVVNIDNGFGAGYIAARINALIVSGGESLATERGV